MKKLIIFAALLIPVVSHGQAVSFYAMHRMCDAEGNKITTFGKCLRGKLDTAYPSWKSADEDSQQVSFYLDYLDAIGKRVQKKELTEAKANEMAKKELLTLATQKQYKLQQAKNAEENALREKQRLESERKEEERRAYAEFMQEKAEKDRYDQLQEALRLQQEQNRIAKNNQMISAGLQLMQLGQRQYAPPAYAPVVPYPSDTTVNVYQGRPYRFWDSRPYQ